MPRLVSSQLPINAEPARMSAAIAQARIATCRRAAGGNPAVTAMKVGTSPTGSTTTNNVTMAEVRKSIGMQAL